MEPESLSRKLLDQLAFDYFHSHGFVEVANCLRKESQILTPSNDAIEKKDIIPKISPKNSVNQPSNPSCNQPSNKSEYQVQINPTTQIHLSSAPVRKLTSCFDSDSRQLIRNATLSGDLKTTQKQISKANSKFFEDNNQILFETRLQELLEAIKQNDLKKCLNLANDDLKQLINDNDGRLEQVQRALSLMIQENKYNKDLLDSSRRLFLWSEINRASLACQVPTQEPGNTQSSLDSIYQVGKWAERKLSTCAENNPDFRRSYFKGKVGKEDFGAYDFMKLITEESSLRYRARQDSQTSTSTTTEKKVNRNIDGMLI